MSGREWTGWIAATLVVAAIVHFGVVLALPYAIEHRLLVRMGAPDRMHFGKRPDETARAVVRPSPDLLYATCPFDLSRGPLRITARVPHSTYWSVSGYDAATNNFFARDDGQILEDSIEIIVLKKGMTPPPPDTAPARETVTAPSDTGIFLFRLLINDESKLAALESIQHQAACGTVGR